VIFGFPSREFGWQEFAKNDAIAEFAKKKEFPGIMMKLGKVKGEEAPELWRFFQDETDAADPLWNFQGKFLVSKTGVVSEPTNVVADIDYLINEESSEVENSIHSFDIIP